MPDKKEFEENRKELKDNPSGIYEFANDKLGENRDPYYEHINPDKANKEKKGNK
ncbi:MAG: hypothetical protein ACOYWZ_10270 [Bacillota bacterium]